jgi:hypothetical protein
MSLTPRRRQDNHPPKPTLHGERSCDRILAGRTSTLRAASVAPLPRLPSRALACVG